MKMIGQCFACKFSRKISKIAGSKYVCKKPQPNKFGWGITIMNDAWKAHKQDALISLRLERASDGYPWTAEEVKGLTKILGKEPWFVSAEKLATKPD